MLIRLIAPGQPISGKNHMRPVMAGKRQIIVKGKAAQRWFGHTVPTLARQFAALGMPTIKTPVHVELCQFLRFDLDSSANPDGDNVEAAVFDALVHAYALADDRLVRGCTWSRERDAANPRVEIEVRVLDGWR
jgi:Holliday junction resolvase RusA-like endonuclease